MTGLGQQLLRLVRIVHRRRQLLVELEVLRNDAAGDVRMAERQRLVDRVVVERVFRGEPHPLVVPRRLRIPLLGEIQPIGRRTDGRPQRQSRRALQFLGQLGADRIGDVDLATLQCGESRRLIGDHPQHDALHARRLAPVLVERLQHQFDARRERDELVRPGADRRLLESVLADLLDVFARHDPAGAGGDGIEGDEVRPGILQLEHDALRIGRFHRRHALLQQRVRRATIALERELHVIGGDRIAVVELRTLAQDELVAQPVLAGRPGLRQRRRRIALRHRLRHRVVQRVQHHERRDDACGLRRIEPGRRQRDVHADGQLTRRRGRLRRAHRARRHTECGECKHIASCRHLHRAPSACSSA